MSDQQRWDAIGVNGGDYVPTPNLDRLACRGLNFTNTCVQSAICTPSRASLVSARYMHEHGAHTNGTWIDDDSPNWVASLRDSGYRTVNVGKMHSAPVRNSCGFQQRWILENKNHDYKTEGGHDDYDYLLTEQGLTRPALSYPETVENWYGQLGTTIWPLADELYPDNVVGKRSVETIKTHDFSQPLMLWSGFAGPHDPYDVPASALERYGKRTIPMPIRFDGELDTKPSKQKWMMDWMEGNTKSQAAIWWSQATKEKLEKLRRNYYTNVMIIDEWVGKMLDALEDMGELENTIVVYTSDHGDALGDHDCIYKFNSFYDSVVRVPLVMAGPGIVEKGRDERLVELIDVGPTLLELAGVDPLTNVSGRSLKPLFADNNVVHREAAFSEFNGRFMIRTLLWKLVYWASDQEGELYDLSADPDELINLFGNPEYATTEASLLAHLFSWRI